MNNYDEILEGEKSEDAIVEVEKGIDEIVEILKFNPFHDARGRFSNKNGFSSYSANPKTKAGAMAISRSAAGGHGRTLNVHRESKGESIAQNDKWLKTGQKPKTPAAVSRAKYQQRKLKQQQAQQSQTQQAKPSGKTTKPTTAQQKQQAQQAKTVNVKQRMKSGVTMDADFDTSKVAGAKNKEFRGTAEGKDLTKSFDARKVAATDNYGGQLRYTDKVADMQGFNSPPKVVSKAEFNKLAKDYGDEMYRTWGSGFMDGKRLSGKGFMNEFNTNGDMKMNGPSGRVYGDGFYVTSAKMNHGKIGTYTKNDVAAVKKESRYYGDGKSTTQMTWLSKPNIVTKRQLSNEWNKLSRTERAKFGDHMNTYACAKGYDAVYTNSSNYMVIFNRSKLAVLG